MENNIRLGKISAIDYAAGTVRVVYHEKDDAVTAPIPLISSEYFMPEVDDMVMVLHLSNGTEAGVVLGRPWSEKNKPPEGSKGLYRKDLARSPGEAMIRYKDGTLTIKAAKLVIDHKPDHSPVRCPGREAAADPGHGGAHGGKRFGGVPGDRRQTGGPPSVPRYRIE